MKSKDTHKTKRLYSVWELLFGVFSLGTSICIGYFQGFLEIDVYSMPSVFQLILIAIITLFFIPFLLFIRKKAILHKDFDTSAKALKTLLIVGIAAGGTLVCNILATFSSYFQNFFNS